MSFGGSDTTISTEEPKLLSFRIQTSSYGLSIPVVWGTARLPSNLLDYDDFTAIAHTTTTSSGGGGKGGGGGVTSTHTSYTYTAAVVLGLCHGPIVGINTVWADKDKRSLSEVGSLFVGSTVQNPWNYMVSVHPDKALGYRGIAYIANSAIDLGSGGSLKQYSFEVQGRSIYGSGVVDCKPKTVLTDLLSDPHLGVSFPAASIGSLTDYENYCLASKFFVSPAVAEQAPAHQLITQLMLATNSDVVWSEGLLKIVPYGDAAVSSVYGSWTPNLTPAYALTDDDFCPPKGEDPVRIIRKSPADAFNQVLVEYYSRTNEYNITTAEAKDQANIELFGLRAKAADSLHMICVDEMAGNIADLILRRHLYIRNEYEFELSWKYCRLEPMDIVTITDTAQNIIQQMVRVTEVTEDEYGNLLIRAEEMPGVTATAAGNSSQSPSGNSIDFNISPGNAHSPVFFEPPLSLTGVPEVWIAISGGADFGGCEVWMSTDDEHYARVGVHSGNTKHGVTTALLPSGADPDTTNTLKVDLSTSNGALTGGTLLDRDLFNTLSYVGGELVSYQNANLTGANAYDLTSLRRGVYGTNISSHAAGSTFVRCDEAVFRMPYDAAYKGKTIYMKLRAFNIYGGALQDLSTLTAYTYTVLGAPVGTVAGLALETPFAGTDCSIKWAPYAGASSYKVEVYSGGVLRRTISSLTAPRYTYTLQDAKADGGPYRTLEFRVYAVNEVGESSSPAVLPATNPQAAAPTGVSISAALTSISIFAEKPSDTDYSGTLIWMSQTMGFTPGPLNLVYDGSDNYSNILDLGENTTWYIRIAHYDVFSKDALNVSSEFNATTGAAGGAGVEIVAALPGTGNFEGRIVYLTTDDKLYRYTGSAWTAAVATSDLTGQIVNGQIATNAVTTDNLVAGSVTAAKISVNTLAAITADLGSITAGNMTLDASGYVRGGQTGYDAGAGFWLGYSGAAYKFSLGNSAGNKLLWNGSALTLVGAFNGGSININNKFTVDSSGNVTIKSATTGARVEIYSNVIKVFDSNNVLRVKMGDLSA